MYELYKYAAVRTRYISTIFKEITIWCSSVLTINNPCSLLRCLSPFPLPFVPLRQAVVVAAAAVEDNVGGAERTGGDVQELD